MGFGQKSQQGFSTNSLAKRAVLGICKTTGNSKCTTTVLATGPTRTLSTINITINTVKDKIYNSNNNTLNLTVLITYNSTGNLPYPTIPFTLADQSSNIPMGYVTSGNQVSSLNITSGSTETFVLTFNLDNNLSTNSSYSWYITCDAYYHDGETSITYESNNRDFSFTT